MDETPGRAPAGPLLRTAAALLAALAACGAPRAPQIVLPDDAGAGCEVGEEEDDGARSGTVADTLHVAAPGPLEGRRPPVPGSWAERVAYRHLYATLVEVDCRGRVGPGLASSWEAADGGRRWSFRLRPASTAAPPLRGGGGPGDGRRRAEVVADAWRRTGLPGDGDGPSGADPGGLAVEGEGEHVTVSLGRPLATPGLFAGPRFAVAGDGPPFGLPPGTGSHTPATTGPGPGGGGWLLAPRGEAGPALRIVGHRGGAGADGPRPRDLLDRGVDLVVTRRPAARRYAASLPEYAVEPLPWDRTYVLLVPGLAREEAAREPGDAGGGGDDRPRVLRELARDAVRADARASRPPHWWEAGCGPGDGAASGGSASGARAPASGRPPPGSSDRLLYPEGDAAAEDLAARLAALSGPGGDAAGAGALAPALDAARGTASRLRPVGVAPGRLDKALRDGGDAGYVLALPRRALAPCWSRDGLERRVPWLASEGARPLPLVDTRLHLAVLRDVAGVRLDWDGVPRLTAPVAPAPEGAP